MSASGGRPNRTSQPRRVIRLAIWVWCSKVISATISLVGARYRAVSNSRIRLRRFCRPSAASTNGSAGSRAMALARSRCSPELAVTYHPPQRSANGVRWSVMMAPARAGAPDRSGKTEPTNMPGTPMVALHALLAARERAVECVEDGALPGVGDRYLHAIAARYPSHGHFIVKVN